jgi:hypothetical protein
MSEQGWTGPAREEMFLSPEREDRLVVWCDDLVPRTEPGAFDCRMLYPFAGFESKEAVAELGLEKDIKSLGGYTATGLSPNYGNGETTLRERVVIEFIGRLLRGRRVASVEEGERGRTRLELQL